MRHFAILFISLVTVFSASAQNTVKMSAVKANDYGVTYSLPKTTINITASYTKTVRKAGEFYQYAERYLNTSNPIIKDETQYTLDKITASTKGIVDKEKSYLVEFKSGSTAPFVTLSREGIICTINSDYAFPPQELKTDNKQVVAKPIDPKTYLSEEILRAGSTAKQAELIAKQIYRLRDSRTNILTGEADNMPPDGNAYKLVMTQLEEQEKALMSLFVGTETTETGFQEFEIIPGTRDIDNRIIFRFSSQLGIVADNNLAGAPVYLSLKNKNPRIEPMLTEKEQQELDKKFSKGIIYNIPNKASLEIVFDSKSLLQYECDIVQYGVQEVLIPKLFENGKKPIQIIFYPELGAIKQIIE